MRGAPARREEVGMARDETRLPLAPGWLRPLRLGSGALALGAAALTGPAVRAAAGALSAERWLYGGGEAIFAAAALALGLGAGAAALRSRSGAEALTRGAVVGLVAGAFAMA